MTPQIFPGLKPPTSQLFFDLQAMIAENGGRLRLADILECENIKQPKNKIVRKLRSIDYTKSQIDFIKDNYNSMTAKGISLKLNRSLYSVRVKVYQLQMSGVISYKTKKK